MVWPSRSSRLRRLKQFALALESSGIRAAEVGSRGNRAPAFEMRPIPGEDLIHLDHDLIGTVDPLYPRRTIPEWRSDAGLPEFRQFEHV